MNEQDQHKALIHTFYSSFAQRDYKTMSECYHDDAQFKDELIINHQDDFDFWRWSTQALGISGLIFGWSAFLKKKVQSEVLNALNTFNSKHLEYQHV